MSTTARLAFDPIERAGELWGEHIGDATAMRLATSIMRVQQVVLAALDAALKPFGITFARYEVLVLLSFSRSGSLPLSKVGERLMVHPTSVTNLIDRLEAQGLVARTVDAADRRRILASLTPAGRRVLKRATVALTDIEFAVGTLDVDDQEKAYELLRSLRSDDFD
jgi:DNA-binding MarR family transcriptional regulator